VQKRGGTPMPLPRRRRVADVQRVHAGATVFDQSPLGEAAARSADNSCLAFARADGE
jgi:hypothetical protein